MNTGFALFPEQASTMAARVDALYFFLIGVSVFFALLISLLIVLFVFKYRRRGSNDRPPAIHADIRLEILWTVVPLILTLGVFAWGAHLYFITFTPPANALEINIVAKQWMWKIQHPGGRSEIDELHIPMGRPIKLLLTSQDVIHDFYVPAFRVKTDVVPGRYTTLWFEPSKVGEYRLFCAEYCGTQHSGMIGRIVVMPPARYQSWLSGNAVGITMAEAGAKLFEDRGCSNCHKNNDTGRGPSLIGLFGKNVRLSDGQRIVANETYLRESIVNPRAKIVAGYEPVMPTFQGQITEEGLLQLVAYLKVISQGEEKQAKQ